MDSLTELWVEAKERAAWEKYGLNPRLREKWLAHKDELRRKMEERRPVVPVHHGAVSLADLMGR